VTSPLDTLVIRRAESRDLPALGRLGASLMRTHYGFDSQRFLPPGDDPEGGYAWFLGSQLDEPEVVVLVAERGEAILGYAYAGIEPLSWKELRGEAGFVHDLVVADTARGAGIGKQLLDAAIAWLRERKMPRVVLWTAVPNQSARRLFERRGFRSTMIEMTLELD
jgi:ribosomal protein S18 acetylase RimI-like enzyme